MQKYSLTVWEMACPSVITSPFFTIFVIPERNLDFFGLTSLRELPQLDDKRELQDIAKEMNIQLWPEEDEAPINEESESPTDDVDDSSSSATTE